MVERTVHRDETYENFLSPGTVHRDGLKNCPQRKLVKIFKARTAHRDDPFENFQSPGTVHIDETYENFLSPGTAHMDG